MPAPVTVSVPPPARVPTAVSAAVPRLQLLFERNDDATADNPLTYRERAYLVPEGASVVDAEEALYGELEQMQASLAGLPPGRFVMLSMFDEPWAGRPTVQPVVVVEWKDWRGGPAVRYPAAEAAAQPALTPQAEQTPAQMPRAQPPAVVQARVPVAEPSGSREDRLALAFEALSELPTMAHAAQALDHVAGLLDSLVPCAALAACLYDINDDSLRIVAARGHAAMLRTGTALPRSGGLLGSAVHIEDRATVFDAPQQELGFVVTVDSCPGLDARSLLVRPISREGQLLGALQLLNRSGAPSFSADDVSVVNYIARQLADALLLLRIRRRA